MQEEVKAEEVKVETKPEKEKLAENVVFVGRKPAMAYVLGVITQFTNGQPEVHVRARGRSISKAVDVAEIIKRRFMQDVKVKDIEIGTEEKELEDKTKINVSTINIVLAKE